MMGMRISSATLLAIVALGAAGCSRYDEHRDSAARQAGKSAYKVAQDTRRAAKKAGHELRESSREAHKGWHEAKEEARAKEKT
jgi:hypothetical protein